MKAFIPFPVSLLVALLVCLSPLANADTGTDELTVSSSFNVNATVIKGCLIGGGATDVTKLGTLSFGAQSGLTGAVNVVSSSGAGSVIIKCTPETTVTIAIDKGLNAPASVAAGRLLRRSDGSETLAYQIYKDGAYSQIWGDDANGGAALTLTASGIVQEIKLYARLFAVASLPPAGKYDDTVTVTVTY